MSVNENDVREKLHDPIETAIRVYEKLLTRPFPSPLLLSAASVLSEASLQSQWVMTELRKYFISDFSQWHNHENFGSAFSRLRKELNCKRHRAVMIRASAEA